MAVYKALAEHMEARMNGGSLLFDLVHDFATALEAMPQDHPRRRIVRLLGEALRRDLHFLARRPTALFQCMWNTCWWYDCEQAPEHYIEPEDG